MLRHQEFARLDAHDVAYLDYGGAALYADSQIAAHWALLKREVFGNPHSEHASSLASARAINRVRQRVLRFFDADDSYVVCFTANATAAIKLVAESYPFSPRAACVLSADNHNSVNGIREYARRAGARVQYLPLTHELRLDDPERRLAIARSQNPTSDVTTCAGSKEAGGRRSNDDTGGPEPLFAYPAQSNFSGVHHPLSLVGTAQSLGYRVMLDAAAYVPTHALSLSEHPADFVAISFYKMFGYPTGVGALIARRDALEALERPWFAGGTVDFASVQLDRHQLRPAHAAFEDGTPNFLDIAAIEDGFTFVERVGLARMADHATSLAKALVDGLSALRHPNGAPVVGFYGLGAPRGATVTFNVMDAVGRPVPFGLVEWSASEAGVHLRGGCFCNPGAAEAAFGFGAARMAGALDALGRDFSIPRLQQRMGPGVAVGALRASLGLANTRRDVTRCVDAIASFATSRSEPARPRRA